MKLSNYITASFCLSFLVHIILMLSLAEVKIASPLPVNRMTMRKPTRITVWPIMPKVELPKPKTRNVKNGKNDGLAERTMAESEREIKEIFEKEHLAQSAPRATARFAGIEKAKIMPRLPTPPEAIKATAPRPKIVEIDVAKLPPERIGQRVVLPRLNRADVPQLQLPSLLPEGPLTEGAGPVYDVGLKINRPKFAPPAIIPDDEPGQGIKAGPVLGTENMLDTADLRKGKADNLEAVPFDQFVNTKILVKDTPDGGYFMLQISANVKSEAVREIYKDVMLILDKSSSIPYKKFSAFKDAAISSLDYLNPSDRFNIVTFADKPVPFATGYVPANKQNLAKARQFISRLSKGGMTNLFDSLYPFVKGTDAKDGRPLNIFLLTDGISTVNIYKDDDFIRMVTSINPGHVSIFPFCAGNETNQELLDFIGFLNRGTCLHSAKLPNISTNLTKFITEHCSLLIRDLEYIAEGNVAESVYPRKLQHLYRGGNVTLYGRFRSEDQELVITLIGKDYSNTTRDIVLRFNLPNCRRTDAPIDKRWAATKILHLVADKTLSTEPAEKERCTNEIKSLAMQFGLSVPY